MQDCFEKYNYWLQHAEDGEVLRSLRSMNEEDIRNAFSKDLQFGTGGLRGIMTAGTDRMNVYTVYRATEGLARYMLNNGMGSCAVTYDSRINSDVFSRLAAAALAYHGIKVYITKECMPTPYLSYITRYYGCDAGINVTASHNPSLYNGYKVYDKHGCQLTDAAAIAVTEQIEAVDMFERPLPVFEDYFGKEITYTDEQAEQEYINCVLAECLGNAEGLNVAYTPLNGAGYRITPAVLSKLGANVEVVQEQSFPDGRFPTCSYPNPEKAEALTMVMALADDKGSDVVIANDPDSDRLGVAVRDLKENGKIVQLTGNEVGILLCDYVLAKLSERNQLPARPIVVKTIVTSIMVDAVCAKYGAEIVDVLTGFKYIGDVINKLEQAGEADRYVLGFEESCGYLKGTYVRDKDGVVAAALVAECAAHYKRLGKTLCDRMRELYGEFGNYFLRTTSYRFDGAAGAELKEKLLADLRVSPIEKLGASKVVKTCDFLTQKQYDLPRSDVLRYNAQDGSQLIIRPSGMEPLIKCYVTVSGTSEQINERCGEIERQLNAMFAK